MKTTRAMLVIGILMLVLAVIVAQGLRPEETATVSGPAVSGTVSHTAPPPSTNPLTAAHDPVAAAVASPSASPDTMDSTSPTSQPAPISPVELAAQGPVEENERNGAPGMPPAAAASSGTADAGQKTTAPRNNQNRTPEKPGKLVVTTTAPQKPAAGQKIISRTRLEIGSHAATFRFSGVSALKGKAFALKDPDRIVVDLDDSWSINLGRTPANTLIKAVRSGVQEANTRLVFDLHKAPKSFKLVQIDSKTLELQMR